MSPLYEYRCPVRHTHERLRKYEHRDEPVTCLECGAAAVRIVSAHHQAVDGIYSYAPNVGPDTRFERQRAAIREGERVIDGSYD